MKTKRNHAFTLIELLVVITITAILAGLAVPAFSFMAQTQENQMKGINNCKQIILSLKQFSKDNGSYYPDSVQNPVTGGMAQNANDAFRFMIQEQIVADERIFGCPAGYTPNNDIGQAPSYGNALMPGENHWAMTSGQTDTSVGSMPLVFENPATNSWPPVWNADVAGQIQPAVPGRVARSSLVATTAASLSKLWLATKARSAPKSWPMATTSSSKLPKASPSASCRWFMASRRPTI